MVKFNDPREASNRLRSATESLSDPRDLAVVRDYLRELEKLADQRSAEVGTAKKARRTKRQGGNNLQQVR